jgi:hypothetical protein
MLLYPVRTPAAAVALTAFLLSSPARAAELDRYLPADSEVVINLNVRQLLDSPLAKAHGLRHARAVLKDADQVDDILKELGFDPFKDLDRVIVAGPGGTDKDRGLLIAHGRFDRAKFRAKAQEAARDHEDVLKIHKVPDGAGGRREVYEVILPEQGDLPGSLFVALADDTTLLASPGKDYVVDALKQAAGGKAALKDKDFQGLLESVDDRQSLSIAAVGTALKKSIEQAPGGMLAGLEKFTAVAGGLTLGEDIKIEVTFATRDAADAKDLRDTVDRGLKLALAGLAVLGQNSEAGPGLELALDLVKGLKVTARGKTVTIKGRLDGDVIRDALKNDK